MKLWILFGISFFFQCLLAQDLTGVRRELAKYKTSSGRYLSDSYMSTLTELIRQKMAIDEQELLKHDDCLENMQAEYLPAMTNSKESASKKFESQIVSIKVSKSINDARIDQIFQIFYKPEFKLAAIPNLQSMQINDGLICEVLKTPMVGLSHYCYSHQVEFLNQTIRVLDVNVWNDPDQKKYDAPFYFQTGLVLLRQLQDRVCLQTVNYVRGPDIPIVLEAIAMKMIPRSQKHLFEKLRLEAQK